jgi:cytochrome P450
MSTADTTALAPQPALYPPTIVPPPQPLPIWRFLPAFVRNPLRALPVQVYEGDIFVVARSGITIAWVSAPALVEQILVTDAEQVTKSPVEKRVFNASLADSVLISDGAQWRWQRRALAPLFRASDIQTYVPAMAAAAEQQVARWQAEASTRLRAIDEDMTRVTYDVILATMLVGGQPAEAETILRAGNAYLARVSWEMAFAVLNIPRWVPHPATRQMRTAARQLREAVGAIITRRRAEGGAPTDLLGRLLAARHPDTGEPMSDALVTSNLLTLLEAGHETTAKALTWALYLLARAPDWQQRVADEAWAVAGDKPISADVISRLEVTQRVLKEAMRLYPPAPVMARQCAEPLNIGGHRLPAGTQLVIPIYAIHRHRKLWSDPDRFDPDRFLTEAEAGRSRTQYMPFGGGQRVCIGATFALMEATVLLATFVRAARFGWDGRHVPEPISRITLRPAGGMPLRVTMR